MLRFDGVRVTVGTHTVRADFACAQAGLVAIVGPSGAGKSTLLLAAAGFLAPEAGCIRIGGEDVSNKAPGDRSLSVLFQEGNLFPHLDAYRNVALGRSTAARLNEQDRSAVHDVLARVGLQGKEHRMPAQLSGGEQSRVALARVLVQDRPIVLLDEPFSALGPALRTEMLDLVSKTLVATGKIVLLVTHDPDDALHWADQTVFIEAGQALAPMDTRTLFADPPPSLAAYLRN
ncbi:MAG: ATP-binding cassette domain-containing protein [Pseudomonadota bacterium]